MSTYSSLSGALGFGADSSADSSPLTSISPVAGWEAHLRNGPSHALDTPSPTDINLTLHSAMYPTPSTDEDFYRCLWKGSPCGRLVAGNRSAVAHHLHHRHGVKLDAARDACLWDMCVETMRRDSFARHVVKHLGMKWHCSVCGKPLSRNDSTLRHADHSGACLGAHVVEMRGPGAVSIPTDNVDS
ncbi:hypothetical protein BV22DRAFT_827454 [Leucogyrophana mollusca]|uniref:Uncharacterized protein n=1 Tax=Leucogyrophana mollusca TaxID=85980 RepID=A0ACB8B4N5_9AGAM|nr:hypothetical protein BV22DRAFT_827454 [Leucogyrophana mollusca]